MKLELKHLAPYLPYGLMINCDFQDGDILSCKMECLSEDEAFLDGCDWDYKNGSEFKPILRPLSDLTKEIEIGGEIYIGRDEFSEVEWNYYQEWEDILHLDYASVLQLIKRHFDVFGLIEVGLAISYSELNNKTDLNNEIEDTTSQMNKSFNTSKDV